jgi:hypothetical protein
MTTKEAGEALASLVISSTQRPLLEMWKTQRPTFQVMSLPATVTKPQADPPFWKTVADAWVDDFLFKAYLRQEKKRVLLASLPATLLTPTQPSSLTAATTKTTISNADDVRIPSPIAIVAPPCSPLTSTLTKKKTMNKPWFPLPKPPTRKTGRWRYVSAEEWAKRQTREEEFMRIAEGCTHLGPHSAWRVIPYPPLPTASSATADRTTFPFIFLPLTDKELPQLSGSKSVWE